jgi:FlaG/FlaF family flagellin (archaellin)
MSPALMVLLMLVITIVLAATVYVLALDAARAVP